MPIKWSAVKVNEAMDDVEKQVSLAEATRNIADLPQYMGDRIRHLISDIERIDYVRGAIKSVRSAIPNGAIEAERESTRHGSTQSLI